MALPMPYPDDGFFPYISSSARPGRRGERADVDQAVAEGVLARLLGHDSTGDQHIDVRVQNGVAILTGWVDSLEIAVLAGDLAWRTPGIHDVCNALAVPDHGLAGLE